MPKLSDVPFTPETDEVAPPSSSSPPQIVIHLAPLATPEAQPSRWLTFEQESSINQIAIIGALSLLLVGGFWFAFNRLVGHSVRTAVVHPAVSVPAAVIRVVPAEPPRAETFVRMINPPIPSESMHGPTDALHAAPVPIENPATPAPESAIVPGKLAVRFIAPRTLDVQWASLGEGYTYRLYWAMTSGLYNPESVLEQPLPVTYLVWTPEEELQDFWLAVKGYDSQGHETGFSPPTQIHVPR